MMETVVHTLILWTIYSKKNGLLTDVLSDIIQWDFVYDQAAFVDLMVWHQARDKPLSGANRTHLFDAL